MSILTLGKLSTEIFPFNPRLQTGGTKTAQVIPEYFRFDLVILVGTLEPGGKWVIAKRFNYLEIPDS